MTAIVGVVLAYAAIGAGRPEGAADVPQDLICAPGEACEPAVTADESPTYATPAEVDCRAISDGPGTGSRGEGSDLRFFSDPCGPVTFDFRYRVSRFPDSERPSGAFAPQRARRAARVAATCTGLPPEHGMLVLSSVPPIAMYAPASIPLPPREPAAVSFEQDRRAPSRILEPPDRPPRG